MLKKIIVIVLVFISIGYSLHYHAPDEEVCDMHAFTQYNQYLAAFNKNLIFEDIVSKVHLGKTTAKYKILQFCNFQSKECLQNYKTLSKVFEENKNLNINIFYYNKTSNHLGQEIYIASIIVYLAKGQEYYQKLVLNIADSKIINSDDLNMRLKILGLSEEIIDKYKPEAIEILKHSKKLAKELKISHTPAVFILPRKNANEKNIYFSEYRDVPKYIIYRALTKIKSSEIKHR